MTEEIGSRPAALPGEARGLEALGRPAVLLFGLAFVWAAGGSVLLLTSASPLGALAEVGGRVGPAVGQVELSLTSGHGVWTVALLALVTILFGVPLGVALAHPPDQRTAGVGVGLLGLTFSLVGGFSVGLTYLPSALLLLAGAALSPLPWRLQPAPDAPPPPSVPE